MAVLSASTPRLACNRSLTIPTNCGPNPETRLIVNIAIADAMARDRPGDFVAVTRQGDLGQLLGLVNLD